MKLKLVSLLCLFGATSLSSMAQTTGNLSLTFTQTPHTSYVGSKNVMAVWIQTSGGQFVRTNLRHVGGGTADHLPTWAVNSGGPSFNALNGSCNVVGAVTGPTNLSFGTVSVTWDGKDANGNVVADGIYKITIQETWNHGSSGTTVRSIPFTKGPSTDSQTPNDDSNFTNLSLEWLPSAAGIENVSELDGVKIYPNPSEDGKFNVEYEQANSIEVFDITGNSVYQSETENNSGKTVIDLSAFNNGMYFIRVADGDKASQLKVILNK